MGLGASVALSSFRARAAALGDPIVVDFAAPAGRLLVAAAVNGKGPFFFTIDTGGTMGLINKEFAAQQGLPVVGERRIHGLSGDSSTTTYLVSDLLLGGSLRAHDVTFQSVNFTLGEDVVGSLPAGTLTRFDSVLDFSAGEWRIYRDGLPPLPGFVEVTSRIAQPVTDAPSYIYVTVMVEGQPFNCIVDTGTTSALILYPRAAKRTRLWNDPSVPYAPVRINTVGGEGAVTRIVRARDVTIGPVRFDAPLIRLQSSTPRFEADGLIGLQLLRQLDLAVDTRHRHLMVKSNRRPVPRDRAPMSGLWIDRRGDRLLVADVGRGSPAEKSGILPGDQVVDAIPQRLFDSLQGPEGANVEMTTLRRGHRRQVTIMLSDYL